MVQWTTDKLMLLGGGLKLTSEYPKSNLYSTYPFENKIKEGWGSGRESTQQ